MFKKAFTMAEILISMTIIGVISVMVLPSITTDTSAKQFLVTYKKTLAVLNQAVDTNYAMSGYDFAGTRENYYQAVGNILENRLGATLDTKTKWTIKGAGGAGFIETCSKSNVIFDGFTCFKSDVTTLLKVNDESGSVSTKVYNMKDGLGSLIILGNSFGTEDQNPCRADGQRTYNPSTGTYSTSANYCLAYLDLNGPKGPNQIAMCNNGLKNSGKIKANLELDGCTVSSKLVDVYPLIIYGDTVAPASAAGLAVFQEIFRK